MVDPQVDAADFLTGNGGRAQVRRIGPFGSDRHKTGDFPAAVKWQQRVIDILPANDSRRSEFHELLKRYQAGKPYHRLGLLREIGIQRTNFVSKQGG